MAYIIKPIDDSRLMDTINLIQINMQALNNNSYENGKNKLVKTLHNNATALTKELTESEKLVRKIKQLDATLAEMESAFKKYSGGLDILRLKLNKGSKLHSTIAKTLS